jgi:hypothetical protein
MTRDSLEAVIWRAMRAHLVTCPGPVDFVDTLLKAADGYARDTYQAGLIADRRKALAEAVSGVAVHYAAGLERDRAACRRKGATTPDARQVTCGACKRTGLYLSARAVA